MENYLLHNAIKLNDVNNQIARFPQVKSLEEMPQLADNPSLGSASQVQAYLLSLKFDEKNFSNNIINLDTITGLLKVFEKLLIPEYFKKLKLAHPIDELNTLYLSFLNEALLILSHEVYYRQPKNIGNTLIYVWKYFFKRLNILSGQKPLKLLITKNLNWVISSLLERPISNCWTILKLVSCFISYINKKFKDLSSMVSGLIITTDHALRIFIKVCEVYIDAIVDFSDDEKAQFLEFFDILVFDTMKMVVKTNNSPCVIDSNCLLIKRFFQLYSKFKQGLPYQLEIYFDYTFNYKLSEINKHFTEFKSNKLLIFTVSNSLIELLRTKEFVLELFSVTELKGQKGGSFKIFIENCMSLLRNVMKATEEPAEIAHIKSIESKILGEINEYMKLDSTSLDGNSAKVNPNQISLRESIKGNTSNFNQKANALCQIDDYKSIIEKTIALTDFYNDAEIHMSSLSKFDTFVHKYYPEFPIGSQSHDLKDNSLSIDTQELNMVTESTSHIQQNDKSSVSVLDHAQNSRLDYSNYKAQKNPLLLYMIQTTFKGERLTNIIGAETKQSEDYRKLFIELFDFNNMALDEAMRRFLLIFKMKGETQMIERILTALSHYYHNSNSSRYGSADNAFLVMYAIMMLNTDNHTEAIKDKMGLDSFRKTIRYGLTEEFITDSDIEVIYKSVNTREIQHFDFERFTQKPDSYSNEDWQYICEFKERMRSHLVKKLFPESLSLVAGEVFSNRIITRCAASFLIQKRFQSEFFDNLSFVLEKKEGSYEFLDLVTTFFNQEGHEFLYDKLITLISNFVNSAITVNSSQTCWLLESYFILTSRIIGKNNQFIDLWLNLFTKHFKTLFHYFEDSYMMNLNLSIESIKTHRKTYYASQVKKSSFANFFTDFLKEDSADEDHREQIEKAMANKERQLQPNIKINKNLFNDFIETCSISFECFQYMLDKVHSTLTDKAAKDYQQYKSYVFLLYALKDVAIKSENNNILVLFIQRIKELMFYYESNKIKGTSLCLANFEYMLILLNFTLISRDNLSNITYDFTQKNDSNDPTLSLLDDKTVNADHIQQDSISDNQLQLSSFLQSALINLHELLKILSPDAHIYLIRDLNMLASNASNGNEVRLKEFIRFYTNVIVEKEIAKFNKTLPLADHLNKLYVNLFGLVLNKNFEENLFFLFEMINTFDEKKLSLNVYALYLVFLSSLEQLHSYESQASINNRMIFLIIERLEFGSPKNLEVTAKNDFFTLAQKLAKMINYGLTDIERTLYVFKEFVNLQAVLSKSKLIPKRIEILDVLNHILTSNLQKLYEAGLLLKTLQMYLPYLEELNDADMVT